MTDQEKLERLRSALRRALAARREHTLAEAELRAAVEDAYGEPEPEPAPVLTGRPRG